MSHDRMVRHRLRERRARARIVMILSTLLLAVGACSTRAAGGGASVIQPSPESTASAVGMVRG